MRVMTPSTALMVVALIRTSNLGQLERVEVSDASAVIGFARSLAWFVANSPFSCLHMDAAFSAERPPSSNVQVEDCSSSVRATAEPTVP